MVVVVDCRRSAKELRADAWRCTTNGVDNGNAKSRELNENRTILDCMWIKCTIFRIMVVVDGLFHQESNQKRCKSENNNNRIFVFRAMMWRGKVGDAIIMIMTLYPFHVVLES